MPVIESPYETYMGQRLDVDQVRNINAALSRYVDSGRLQGRPKDRSHEAGPVSSFISRDTDDVYGITPIDWRLDEIPFFGHPMIVKDKKETRENSLGGLDNFKVITDFRSVMSDVRGIIKITNRSVYAYMAARAVINHWWLSHGTIAPISSMSVAVPIFANFVGEQVGGTVKMEADDALRLRVWAAIWYYMAHTKSHITDLKADEKFRIYRFMQQHVRIDADFTADVMESAIAGYDDNSLRIPESDRGSINHWLKLTPVACSSVRLESALNDIGAFIGMLGRGYIGPLNVETMAIAFEHPPTWLALVWASANSYTPSSSALAKMVQRPIYRDGISQLVRGVNNKLELSA